MEVLDKTRDPSALPPELFDSILDYLTPDVSFKLPLATDFHEWDQLADLFACNIVNRAWHVYTLPRLYRSFRYEVCVHSFSRLWKFLRTVVQKPSLAALVRGLYLGSLLLWEPGDPSDITTDAEERQMRRQNREMREVTSRLDIGSRDLSVALREKLREPYLLLLISSLPNISRLYLACNQIPANWSDQFCKALQFLRKVEVVILHPNADSLDGGFTFTWTFNDAHRLFFLPSLEELVLFRLNIRRESTTFVDPSTYRTSTVKKLIVCPTWFGRHNAHSEREYLQAILQLPRSLVSLTLCMGSREVDEREGLTNYVSGDELWQILYHSRDSLEYLDVYDIDATVNRENSQQKSHLGQLCEFRQLKELRIQLNVLMGGANGIVPAPYKLGHTLPESLESLTFYHYEQWDRGLRRQCTEFVRKDASPQLRSLTLQIAGGNVNDAHPRSSPLLKRYYYRRSGTTVYILRYPCPLRRRVSETIDRERAGSQY